MTLPALAQCHARREGWETGSSPVCQWRNLGSTAQILGRRQIEEA